ncbi:MAG: aldolase/citrate lyase family protein [Acidobacteriota bacterium]|nr:aldolase/citrate lyase family protein [Acidobacteriota bacterium]
MTKILRLATTIAMATALVAAAMGQDGSRIYNTVKQKLAEGKQVVGGTVSSSDPDAYCAMANAGFDFLWIEMQHSPLTYQEVARMIWACRGAPAIPFIRVPDATEGDIQKATDIGALGIIVPMVHDADKMREAVRVASYPPEGQRSQGGGQYGALWGRDYRRTANDNIMVFAMIESVVGVNNAAEIAAVPGVDGLFAAATDLRSFSGLKQEDPEFEALVDKIRQGAQASGKILGGPFGWTEKEGFLFFQGPGTGSLIRRGARSLLEERGSGDAPIEGSRRLE